MQKGYTVFCVRGNLPFILHDESQIKQNKNWKKVATSIEQKTLMQNKSTSTNAKRNISEEDMINMAINASLAEQKRQGKTLSQQTVASKKPKLSEEDELRLAIEMSKQDPHNNKQTNERDDELEMALALSRSINSNNAKKSNENSNWKASNLAGNSQQAAPSQIQSQMMLQPILPPSFYSNTTAQQTLPSSMATQQTLQTTTSQPFPAQPILQTQLQTNAVQYPITLTTPTYLPPDTSSIQPEPAVVSKLVDIAITLPNGVVLQNKFYNTQTIESLYNFVQSKYPQYKGPSYLLSLSHSGVFFDDGSRALWEVGLDLPSKLHLIQKK